MSVSIQTYRIELRPVRCVACNGLGVNQVAHWVTLHPDGSPDRLYVQDGAGWREVKDQPGA